MSENTLISKFRLLIEDSEMRVSISDELLLCFIRARKNELNRAMRLLKNYVKMSKNYHDLFTGLSYSNIEPILAMNHFLVLPLKEQNGRRVFFATIEHWDVHKLSLDDIFRTVVYCLQKLVSEFETQTNGLVVILDFKGLTLYQVGHFTPVFLKKIADLVQDVFPVRLQGIHVVHEPWVFKLLLSMIWPFLSPKIRNRIFFHGHNYAELHKKVNPSCLPSELGGRQGSIHSMKFQTVLPASERNIFDSLRIE